jgi:hypothetical protein
VSLPIRANNLGQQKLLTKGVHQMDTLNRIRAEQQARYAIQREKDKAKIEAMFSNNARPLNNDYELKKVEN